MLIATGVATALLAGTAHAAPSSKIGVAQLITPTSADAYYAAQSSSVPSLGDPRPAELVELARALSNNVDHIYDFVRNNVETTFMHGLQKGALGALLDRSGTPFDQAHLMVELLRQAGHTASYRYGTITLDGAQFTAWAGTSNARAACQLLSSGGIPGRINSSSTNVDCSTFGALTALSSAVVSHIWVVVNIGGTDYLFDPSYKAHASPAAFDLTAATQFVAGQSFTAATGGMTSSSASGVGYVSNLASETLNGRLQTYGNNLLSYINANAPSASIETILGVPEITRQNVPASGLRQTALPYPTGASPAVWSGNIPDVYRTTLRVEFTKQMFAPNPNLPPDQQTVLVTFVDRALFVDEIYGRNLVLRPNHPVADPQTGATFSVSLRLVGRGTDSEIMSYTRSNDAVSLRDTTNDVAVRLTANHPYAADAAGSATAVGNYMDAVSDKQIALMSPVTIVHGWGDAGAGLMEAWGDMRDTPIAPAPYEEYGCDACEQYYYSTRGDGKRAQMAVGWLIQSSRAAWMHAALAKSVYTHHHSIGIASADTWAPGQLLGGSIYYVIADSFERLDVDSAFSVTSKTASSEDRRAAIHSIAATTEALEGSVAAQAADLPDTTSTATRFEWANRPNGVNAGAPRRFYGYTNSNGSQAANLTVAESVTSSPDDGQRTGGLGQYGEPELGNDEIQDRRTAVANAITAYTGAGFDVVASEDAFLGPGQRGGPARIVSGLWLNARSQQRGGALIATRYVGGEPVEIAHAVVSHDDISKGGGGGVQSNHQSQYDPAKAADILKARFVDRSQQMGVDLRTGKLSYTTPAQLTVGNGGFPYELSAQLIWRGGQYVPTEFGPIVHTQPQAPWTTNWTNNLTVSSSALEAMGTTDARAAAGTIAAFIAQQDIYKASPSAQREVAAVLAGSWWMNQLSGNAVTVSVGASTRQFVRGVDGQWLAPGAGPYARLSQTGTRTPFAQTCTGTVGFMPSRGWDYTGVSYVVTNAQGDTQNFVHWKNDYRLGPANTCGKMRGFRMSSWTFPFGMSINLVYTSPGSGQLERLTEVNNTFGRKIVFTYENYLDAPVNGFNNGLAGGDYRGVIITNNLGKVTDVRDPAGAITRFTTSLIKEHLLEEVFDANDTTTPSLRYVYDSLNRVKEARDAISLQESRPAHQFFIADAVRSERVDPAGGRYTIFYDLKSRPMGVMDELGRLTSITNDGRGRVSEYTYPEGDKESFAYDIRNNATTFTRTPKPGSALSAVTITAQWHATWNKPEWIREAMHTGSAPRQTDFVYYPSGNGTSLLQTATRPSSDGVEARPVYSFTYNTRGQLLDTTDPTGLVVRNAYNPSTGNRDSATLAPSGPNEITSFSYYATGDVRSTTNPRNYATSFEYDNNRRKTITKHHNGVDTANVIAAQRTYYNVLGEVDQEAAGIAFSGTNVTTWQTVKSATYTPNGKVRTQTNGENDVTTFAYDAADRLVITTDGMNRRTASVYNLAGETVCAWRGWNSTSAPTHCSFDPAAYTGVGPVRDAQYTYTLNGQRFTVLDANNNLSTFEYDGLDRLVKLRFPLPTKGANASSTTDFEQYTYYPSGQREGLRKRDGRYIRFEYDRLDRQTRKYYPSGGATQVWSTYDLAGRPLWHRLNTVTGYGIGYTYDSAKRLWTERSTDASYDRTLTFNYDAAGNRTRLTFPDGQYFQYDYDALDRMTDVRENGATSGPGVLAHYEYDVLSRPDLLTRGNGSQTDFGYDLASRLSTHSQNFAGTTYDLSRDFRYNGASQLRRRRTFTDVFDWQAPTLNKTYVADGLNRYGSVDSVSYTYDANGNLTSDGQRTFTYDIENRLLTVTGSASMQLSYDPLGRLRRTYSGPTTTLFLYDGDRLLAEYNGSLNVVRRYVHGRAVDDPLVWYEGAGLTDRRWLHADERGSVIATSDGSANATVYKYGPYGEPSVWSGSRFRYTGQIALPEVQLYHYKARVYDPVLGRFLQTDPIGYEDDFNLYAYVGNDPANMVDPSGESGIAIFARWTPMLEPVTKLSQDPIPPTTVQQGIRNALAEAANRPPKVEPERIGPSARETLAQYKQRLQQKNQSYKNRTQQPDPPRPVKEPGIVDLIAEALGDFFEIKVVPVPTAGDESVTTQEDAVRGDSTIPPADPKEFTEEPGIRCQADAIVPGCTI